MTIRKYSSLDAITKESAKNNVELLETHCSYSFRVFENKQTKFLHIYYKTN